MLAALTRTFNLLLAPAFLDPVDSPHSSVYQCAPLDPKARPLSLLHFQGRPLLFVHGPAPPSSDSLSALRSSSPDLHVFFTPNFQNVASKPAEPQLLDEPSSSSEEMTLLHERDVTGPETSTLYRFLRRHAPSFDLQVGHAPRLRTPGGAFLCDRYGQVVAQADSVDELLEN